MIAPSMDVDMLKHPATARNLSELKSTGVLILDAPEGELASGLTGKGRMLEPEDILNTITGFFSKKKTLSL